MVKFTEIIDETLDSELSSTSKRGVKNYAIYNAIEALKKSLTFFEEKEVSITSPRLSGQTEFNREVSFRTGEQGDVKINLFVNLSRTLTVKILFDGKVVKSTSFTSATTNSEVVLSGVPAGIHSAKISITGSSFSVTNFCLTVRGKFVDFDDDIFIDAFTSGAGYIKNDFGRLDIYSFSSGTSTNISTFYGFKKARAITCGSTDYVVAVTETGNACLISDVYTTTPTYTYICESAKAISASSIDGVNIDIFVSLGEEVDIYRYNSITKIVRKLNGVAITCDDIASIGYDSKLYMLSVENGQMNISESLPIKEFSSTDRFTVNVARGV
jgi:hypothetical protein